MVSICYKPLETVQNPKGTLKELSNLRPYVYKCVKHKFLCKRAIPLHSHYQLPVGDPVPSCLFCCCRLFHSYTLNQMRELTKIKPSGIFQVSINEISSPEVISFVLEKKKRKKKWGMGSCGQKEAELLPPAAIQP